MPIAKVNGIDLNFKVEGQGKPLLLITGIGLDLGSLDAQSARFGKHFKVIRLDNRGIGKSTKPPGPYSTKMMAEDVVALMDYLQIDKASILGFSMGGMIAQELAINYPGRLDRLVLCATYSCIDNESGLTAEYGKLSGLPKLKYLLGFLKLVTDSRTKPF